MTDLLASHRRLQLQEFLTQGILVVGWHLVCHLTIFTLVYFANASSVVEVLIEFCQKQEYAVNM